MPAAMASSLGEVDLDALVNLDDFETAAKAVMDARDFDYFAGGAESETTLRANVDAFREVTLWPKCFVDVSNVDTSVSFPTLGLPHVSAPLIAAPVAMQKMAHPAGEAAAAIACVRRGIGYCASQQATTSVESIRRERVKALGSCVDAGNACDDAPPMWFQLYVLEDREHTKRIVRSAEKAGCVALVITVDAPVLGKRERDIRNTFSTRFPLENTLDGDGGTAVDAFQTTPVDRNRSSKGFASIPTAVSSRSPRTTQRTLARRIGGRDASADWSVLSWIRSVTSLPVILKGVLRKDDAVSAVTHGAAAIWVSNHGGRQLDGATATLRALPGIVEGVAAATSGGTTPKPLVVFDGGVRRGVDAFKALALGADLVAFGRPLVWGLACGGEAGVDRVISTLTEELKTTMALCGVNAISKIKKADVARVHSPTTSRSRL